MGHKNAILAVGRPRQRSEYLTPQHRQSNSSSLFMFTLLTTLRRLQSDHDWCNPTKAQELSPQWCQRVFIPTPIKFHHDSQQWTGRKWIKINPCTILVTRCVLLQPSRGPGMMFSCSDPHPRSGKEREGLDGDKGTERFLHSRGSSRHEMKETEGTPSRANPRAKSNQRNPQIWIQALDTCAVWGFWSMPVR